jgi:hypothetical protein
MLLYVLLAELQPILYQYEFIVNSFVYAINSITIAAARKPRTACPSAKSLSKPEPELEPEPEPEPEQYSIYTSKD